MAQLLPILMIAGIIEVRLLWPTFAKEVSDERLPLPRMASIFMALHAFSLIFLGILSFQVMGALRDNDPSRYLEQLITYAVPVTMGLLWAPALFVFANALFADPRKYKQLTASSEARSEVGPADGASSSADEPPPRGRTPHPSEPPAG